MKVISQTNIDAFPLLSRGKVRDIYGVDESTLLIVTTDRMSAFDVIMGEPIPYKGVILNLITLFWMDKFANLVPNHIIERDINRFPAKLDPWKDELEGRAVLVKKAAPLPLECIVRGHISGSGWKDYQDTGMICGCKLPSGLKESDKLEPAIFTPSTKAEYGEHDENINFERAGQLLGVELAEKVRRISLQIFESGRAHAAGKGIIMADTKFEFGMIGNELTLIDEVMTPDSSRFWPMDKYAPGCSQPSFDKQYLRDWLSAQPWNKKTPAPALPAEVVEMTSRKYREAFEIITGQKLPI